MVLKITRRIFFRLPVQNPQSEKTNRNSDDLIYRNCLAVRQCSDKYQRTADKNALCTTDAVLTSSLSYMHI